MTASQPTTLAELWRALQERLEDQGAVDASARARALAIAALTAGEDQAVTPSRPGSRSTRSSHPSRRPVLCRCR